MSGAYLVSERPPMGRLLMVVIRYLATFPTTSQMHPQTVREEGPPAIRTRLEALIVLPKGVLGVLL